MINKNDLETINQIADYRCREYYELVLEALIVLVIGIIVGLTIFKLAPTTSPDTKSDTNKQETIAPQDITPGSWVKPLTNLRLTSPFGMRLHPTLKVFKPHNGVDFSGTVGTPLYSMSSGVVLRTISDNACGLGAVIQHAEAITSHYCHLSKVSVRSGEKLKPGQRIGDVGNTGRSTGPHLHLGIKKDGRWIDPLPFMKSKGIY